MGQNPGVNTNVSYENVGLLSNLVVANSGSNILASTAAITINGCRAGTDVYDYYAGFTTSIAQQLANKVRRGVYAYKVGMYFSALDAAHDTKFAPEENDKGPSSLPVYMVPVGPPGHKPDPTPFPAP